jgi:Na+/H+-dicarboxylate symporter
MSRFLGAFGRLSLSTRIVLGLGLGILTGLFLGEPAAVLQPVADIYIRLMQMTVLPYLVIALIVGFGQLSAADARLLARKGGIIVVLTWIVTCVVIGAVPFSFPSYETASFFSNALVEPHQAFSVPDLFFTANPFNALSNAVIPAVVLFSGALGIGLIGLPDRERVLDPLRALNVSIVRITKFVIALTPIGVFAIGAVTAGTMSSELIEQLEVYFVAFAVASLLLGFLILPLMVTAVTPFGYLEVLKASRAALLTAFVTNSAFIVLPILVDESKALMEKKGLLTEESDAAAEVLVPILFNFPNAGRLLTLLFVPFAAWLAGQTMGISDEAVLFATGVPAYFAKAQVALPFLIDMFGLPHDLFQLYIPTAILTGKLDSMVAAMNLLAFALLGGAAMGGFLSVRRDRVLRAIGLTAVAIVASVVGLKLLFAFTVDTTYRRDEALRSMQASRSGVAGVHRDLSTVPYEPPASGETTLERVRRRGTLRIGYDPTNLPFAFFNAKDELVGLDVEISRELATALGLTPEFVPISWPRLPEMLAEGTIDVMPGMWYRPYWFSRLQLSTPYLMGTMGLAVEDDRRREFEDVQALRNSHGLRIGVPLDATQIQYSMRRYFDGADVEFVVVETAGMFFEGKSPRVDAFLMPAESGSAWTLLRPEYTIVVPQPDPVRLPYAFGVAFASEDLLALIDEWVTFAVSEGLFDQARDYWVLGQGAEDPTPRWSIIRDVLGWVE